MNHESHNESRLSPGTSTSGQWDDALECSLECYRPGRDDIDDPQFAALTAQLSSDRNLAQRLERIERIDQSIQTAFADVPVPLDLAANILARLSASATASTSEKAKLDPARSEIAPVKVSMATVRVPRELPRPSQKRIVRPRFTRRRALFAVGGFVGTAAAILLAVVWAMHRPHALTNSSLLDGAIAQFASETADHPQGVLVTQTPPPADLPFSSEVVPLRGTRWRHVANFLGSRAVAYDLLPTLGGARATLYVLPGAVPGMLPFAPGQPTGSTGGYSAGAWQVGGTLYVLVVEGDNRAYRSYLDQSHGPIA